MRGVTPPVGAAGHLEFLDSGRELGPGLSLGAHVSCVQRVAGEVGPHDARDSVVGRELAFPPVFVDRDFEREVHVAPGALEELQCLLCEALEESIPVLLEHPVDVPDVLGELIAVHICRGSKHLYSLSRFLK
jgi:hypothetical protein